MRRGELVERAKNLAYLVARAMGCDERSAVMAARAAEREPVRAVMIYEAILASRRDVDYGGVQ